MVKDGCSQCGYPFQNIAALHCTRRICWPPSVATLSDMSGTIRVKIIMTDNGSLDYKFMQYARDVARKSNCRRRQVGAVIVYGDVTIVTASNGTPPGMTPCNQDGCERCLSDTPSGGSYDSCLCMHAEQSAIADAARLAKSTQGATLYCTLRPCIPCLNLCLHAGIVRVVYDEGIKFTAAVEAAYRRFVFDVPLTIDQLKRGAHEFD